MLEWCRSATLSTAKVFAIFFFQFRLGFYVPFLRVFFESAFSLRFVNSPVVVHRYPRGPFLLIDVCCDLISLTLSEFAQWIGLHTVKLIEMEYYCYLLTDKYKRIYTPRNQKTGRE